MGSPEKGEETVRKKNRAADPFTVMIMGKVGRVRTFPLSRGLIFCVAGFFLVYIPTSLFLINGYVELRNSLSIQAERVGQLEQEVSQRDRILLRTKEHVALLEDYIRTLDGTGERSSELVKKDQGSQDKDQSQERGPARKEEITQGRPGRAVPLLGIDEFVARREGSRLIVEFRLTNRRDTEGPVGGYLHVIARGKDPKPPQEWAYPRQKHKDGLPADYRRGQVFLIQKYEQFLGRLRLGGGSERPAGIRVLAYDQSGTLVLEKEFEVPYDS